MLNDKDRRDVAAFAQQDIERAAGGRRIHALEADPPARHCEYQLPRRALGFPSGAENHEFRLELQQMLQLLFAQCGDVVNRNAALNLVPEDQYVVPYRLLTDLDGSRFDLADGKA